jgi:hypothetical protein
VGRLKPPWPASNRCGAQRLVAKSAKISNSRIILQNDLKNIKKFRGGQRRRERKEQGSGDKARTKEMRPALPSRWHGRVGQAAGGRRSMGMRRRMMGRWRCDGGRQGIGCRTDRKKRAMAPTKTSSNLNLLGGLVFLGGLVASNSI